MSVRLREVYWCVYNRSGRRGRPRRAYTFTHGVGVRSAPIAPNTRPSCALVCTSTRPPGAREGVVLRTVSAWVLWEEQNGFRPGSL